MRGARWYIGRSDGFSAIIYDASDLEGDGPNGHGMVCQDAVIEDAVLIAAAPEMYAALVDLIEQIEAYDRLRGANSCAISPDAAIAAVAKAEGRVSVPDEAPDSMEQFLEWEFLYELCEECHGDTRHHSAIWIEGARDADLGHHWVVVCIESNRGHAVCEIADCEEHPGEEQALANAEGREG